MLFLRLLSIKVSIIYPDKYSIHQYVVIRKYAYKATPINS